MKMPYKSGSRHADVNNAYDACSTCYYVKDRTGTLTCTHEDRDHIEVYCLANNGAEEHMRQMREGTQYRVKPDEWCDKYKAQDTEEMEEYASTYEAMESAYEQHSPTPHKEYGTGGTSTGSVGGAGAG